MSDGYLANSAAERGVRELVSERHLIFKRLIVSLLALIAATFALMLWVLGSPDSHHQQEVAQASAEVWPDGSPKTAKDWWASNAPQPARQVAQPPAAPAPPGSEPQNPPPSHRG